MADGVTSRVDGLTVVLRRLNDEIHKIQGRTRTGVRAAALKVRRRSQELVPVDTGNLKGSAYTEVFDGPKGPAAEIGFTAAYAPFVHEMEVKHPGRPRTSGTKKGVYWEVGQPKFLETALHELQREIIETIKKHARVSGTGRPTRGRRR